MSFYLNNPLFDPGELLISDSILTRGFDYLPLVRRHLAGDWHEGSQYDLESNIRSLADNTEILSQYVASDAASIVDLITIVTSADRTYTVIFLASDPTE